MEKQDSPRTDLGIDKPLEIRDLPRVDLGFDKLVRLTKGGPWVLRAFGVARLTMDGP